MKKKRRKNCLKTWHKLDNKQKDLIQKNKKIPNKKKMNF